VPVRLLREDQGQSQGDQDDEEVLLQQRESTEPYHLAVRVAFSVLLELARRALWFPLLVFATHIFLSRGVEAYREHPWLDMPMHFAGGVAIASCISVTLLVLEQRELVERTGPRIRSLLVLALTGCATILWEFAEFTTDQLGLTRAQAGLEDTLLDMALGLVGGLLFLTLSARRASAVRE